MKGSLIPLGHSFLHFSNLTPFNNLFHQNRNSLKTGNIPKNTSSHQGRPVGGNLTTSYFRSTSLSFSLSATYTRVGALEGPHSWVLAKSSPKPLGLDLGGLHHALKEMMSAFEKSASSEDISKDGLDPDDYLKKLIVEKLFGGAVGDAPKVNEVTLYEESYKRIDFSLDYSGLVKWKGAVFQSEFHLELHLEQKEISYIDYVPAHDGLTKLDDRNVDTGRYLVSFENTTSVTIFDKFSRLSTTIWGDPHVDLSDQEGRYNGEFSDLKKSSILTSLKLLDSSTVVIKAPDNGLIEEVHVFKAGEHIKGLGRGALIKGHEKLRHKAADGRPKNFSQSDSHCDRRIGGFGSIDKESDLLSELLSASDVVTAGGDGNDWFDETGRLVWGDGHNEL